MDTLIRNGFIVNYDNMLYGDLLIEKGIIKKIESNIECNDNNVNIIDGKGCLVFPGFIDTHTHPGLPDDLGYLKDTDDFITETKAARMGGTTTIFDFAEQEKGGTLIQALNKRKIRYKDKAQCRYEFHVAVTSVDDDIYSQLEEIKKEGIKSIKIYTTYGMKLNNGDILKIMKSCAELGLILLVHCEEDSIVNYCSKESFYPNTRPKEAEVSMVYTIINFASITGCTVYICHVSCGKSIELIKEAKKQGIRIYLETCPQYLILNSEKYYDCNEKEMTKYILSPPLRTIEDNNTLVEACMEGVVDVISTDHCAFLYSEHKEKFYKDINKAAKGMPGIQLRGSLMYDLLVEKNKMPIQDFVKIMSYNQSNIFKLKDRGYLKEGMKGDLVVFKKEKFKVNIEDIYEGTDYSPYEGMILSGKPQCTIIG